MLYFIEVRSAGLQINWSIVKNDTEWYSFPNQCFPNELCSIIALCYIAWPVRVCEMASGTVLNWFGRGLKQGKKELLSNSRTGARERSAVLTDTNFIKAAQ